MKKLRIGLLGFGQTGSVVANEIVKDESLELVWVSRRTVQPSFTYASHALGFDAGFSPFVRIDEMDSKFLKAHPVDVIIDFSSNTASKMYDLFARNGIRIVTAISKYSDSEMTQLQEAGKKTALLYSPNITLGINWVIMASKILKSIIPHADIEVVEEHFRAKKEVSGTALRIARHLELDSKEHVNSIRVGGVVGKHEVIFGLPFQTIRLTHESINRAAFGTGAIFAAKWLSDKVGGLYSMEQVFHERFLSKIQALEL